MKRSIIGGLTDCTKVIKSGKRIGYSVDSLIQLDVSDINDIFDLADEHGASLYHNPNRLRIWKNRIKNNDLFLLTLIY